MIRSNPDKQPIEILRLNQVLVRTGLPKSSFYEQLKYKQMTEGVKIGLRRVGWPSYEIDEINKALIAGADPIAIKKLVVELTAQRQNLLSEVQS